MGHRDARDPRIFIFLLSASLYACGPRLESDGQDGQDLPLGDDVDLKSDDGSWGPYATQCKPIPTRPALQSPRITVSVAGLTLHLTDDATGFSRVYPVGAGAINHQPGELTSDRSLSLYPVLATSSNSFTLRIDKSTPCAVWWTDPETGEDAPVFAGLPFMRWYGSYGIHGPITGYEASNGGALERGFVSHGCFRMEAADVTEVWAYVSPSPTVPVRVQAEIERDDTGLAVDVPDRWVLGECRADADCNYPGGICLPRAGSAIGFCSARCTKYCDDRHGYPVTFCVSETKSPAKGFCTAKSSDLNDSCRRHPGFRAAPAVPRFGQPEVTADVCMPEL